MAKITLGLFFGGRSTEHEVSVITALQAYENLDKNKYQVVAVYVDKSGQMFTGKKFLELKNYKDVKALTLSSKKVTLVKGGLQTLGMFPSNIPLDVAFPLIHGSFGEDGSLQGAFEINQIPYIGFDVLGSSIGMDKLSSKLIFQSLGLPMGKYVYIGRNEWLQDPKGCLEKTQKQLKAPWIVKPGTIGSSIGVNRADTKDKLQFYIEVASTYSEKIIIEECFTDTIEVNCSALGYLEPKASVCEMPVSIENLLTFTDKYKRGSKSSKGSGMASLQRIIPAPISEKLTKEIQETTLKIFKALDGCGVARVDFFVRVKDGKFWVNEINTIPGSLSFYLWKPKGISYKKLLDSLVQYALERAEEQSKTQYTFESGLLSQMAGAGGIKR